MKLSNSFRNSVVQIAYGTYTPSPQPTATLTPEPYIELMCNFNEESLVQEDFYSKAQYPFIKNDRIVGTWNQEAILRNEKKIIFKVLPIEVGWYEMILHIDKPIDQSILNYEIYSGSGEPFQFLYRHEDERLNKYGARIGETYIPLGILKLENSEEFDITLYMNDAIFESGTNVTLFVSRLDGVYEDAFSSVDNKYGMNKFDYLEFYDWDESNTESEMVLTVSDQNLSEFEDLPYDELFVVELTNFLRSINERTPSTQTNYMIKKYSENIALNIEDLILFRHNLGIEAQCELISFANDENGVFYHETPINNKSNSFADYPDIKLENEGSISLYLICWSEDNTVDISTIDLMSELILMKNKRGQS